MSHAIFSLIAEYGLLLVFINVLVEQAGVRALRGEGELSGRRLVVATVHLDRRPVRADRQRRRGQPLEFPGGVHDLTSDDGEYRLDALDLLLGHGEVVRGQQREICQFADLDGTLLVLFAREPRAADGVAP